MYRPLLIYFSFFTFVLHAQVDQNLNLKWKNGVLLESEDGRFKIKFGGRIQYDYLYYDQDIALQQQYGELQNGLNLRRVRLGSNGTLHNILKYKLQLEFSEGRASIKDAYIELTKLPILGNIRLGQFKEPFSLEIQSSSNFLVFTERSLTTAFSETRNSGLLLYNNYLDKKLAWQVGIMRFGDSEVTIANKGLVFAGRLIGIISTDKVYERNFLHLGVSYNYRRPNDELLMLESMPDIHLGQKYLRTGNIDNVKAIHLSGIEASFVRGPFNFQAEFSMSNIISQPLTIKYSSSLFSFYAHANYFITGESRRYKFGNPGSGYDRIIPKRNFGEGGPGAWQVGLRYTYNDWDDDAINGEKIADISLAVNWHLNPSSRILFNYIFAAVGNIGNTNVIQLRAQVNF